MLTPTTQLLATGYGLRRVLGSAVEGVSMGGTAWAMGKGLVIGKQAICHTFPITNDAASRDFVAQPPR